MRHSHRTSLKGYTLIEMLVAVTLFSIVLMICLGSIMTIVDVNRKSQTLTTVMNDLSFSLENMTRSIKTGQIQDLRSDNNVRKVSALTVLPQDAVSGTDTVTYQLNDKGQITENNIPITSEQIFVDQLRFHIFYGDNNRQPRVLMVVSGTASTSQSISSDFTIQTTVSQRDLETDNFGNPN